MHILMHNSDVTDKVLNNFPHTLLGLEPMLREDVKELVSGGRS